MRLGAFAHAWQSPMSGDSAFLQHFGIDTSAIVTNPNTKHLVIVSDLCFDPSGMSVPRSVPQEFERNPESLTIGNRRQGSPLSVFD